MSINVDLDIVDQRLHGHVGSALDLLVGDQGEEAFDLTDQPRILRTLVGIDVCRNVPGLLIAQGVALTQRHIVLDVTGGGVDAVVRRLRSMSMHYAGVA